MGFRGQAKPAEETLAYASGRAANTRAGASPKSVKLGVELSVLADRRVQAHLGHRRNAMIKYYACLGAAVIFLALVPDAEARVREQQSPAEWRTFEVPDFGTSIQYPASIFTPAGQPEMGLGQRFERADGRAVLSIYARPNKAGETPRAYLRNHLRVERSELDYVRIARSFFAVSSERDGVILYSRCNFSGGAHGVIHCFDMKYPQDEKRSWDAVVTRISLSLRPLEG
jgi:hypothetical protein